MKLKKGDKVVVIAGSNKGKEGIINKILDNKVIVEGVNIVKKHLNQKIIMETVKLSKEKHQFMYLM